MLLDRLQTKVVTMLAEIFMVRLEATPLASVVAFPFSTLGVVPNQCAW
jgi:hypothetical protein